VERSKVFLWILVFAMAGVIVWRVGFHKSDSYLPDIEPRAGAAPSPASAPEPNEAGDGDSADASEPNTPPEVKEPPSPEKPADAERPDRPGPRRPRRGGSDEPEKKPEGEGDDPNATSESGEPMEAVNLKDVEMKKIIDKIATWTGKTVIPHEEAMKQKITIYAPDKLPRAKALEKIYSALRMKNFVAEEVDDTIFLKPIADAKLGMVPTVGADEPLAVFENKDKIVRKFFKLENYPPAQMGQIVQPLVGEYGHVSADETTNTLLVIDTVSNLMSIQRIISQFDVSGAGQTVEEFFEIKHGDPAEIVQLLRMLLGEAPRGSSRGRSSSYRGRPVSSSPSRGGPPSKKGSSGSATSVVIGSGDVPLVLIPVPKAGWIIARGAPDDVKQIHDWIEKLDREEPVTSEYETIPISYANTREVASRIEDALRDMPGTELTPSILVRPLEQSRQIMVFGRADLRDMVKKLIQEIDVPAGIFETVVFDLEHADPEQIKENIDSLYGEQAPQYDSYYYYRYGRGSRGPDSDTVKVIAFPTMNQVTVIASPENMRKIEGQIDEWDVPLDVDAVKPRIIELKNSDPVQLAELLTKLFSEDQDGSSNFFRFFFFGRGGDQRKKIVGPLYGQLTFEDVPGTKKIIVISKIPQAYDVVQELIYDLDRQEMAEIPRVVQLKYADPEDLSERLNAMFNEPGTRAPIRRRDAGLGDYSMEEPSNNQQNNNNNNNSGGSNAGEYVPWWSTGARRNMDEEPISNVIGRVRFIPDPRSKSILVLSPPEFQERIEETIRLLDVPGKQVMIKAIVIEVDHRDVTSLGMQLSSNPADAFGTLGENAVTALGELDVLQERGSATLKVGTDITGLVDFLMKTVNAQILNQQTLWTEDNEEASLFKGDKVAFQTDSSVSEQGGRVTTSFEFERVGMTLAVRPSITPDKSVDMIVNLLLSQLTGDLINGQPTRREMETTTNMIVEDGQTLMLGGILFQEDSKTERKVPLLGDLPLIGGAFRHYDVSKANSELIIFITPYVVDNGEKLPPETIEEINAPRRTLEKVQGRLDQTADELEEKVEKK